MAAPIVRLPASGYVDTTYIPILGYFCRAVLNGPFLLLSLARKDDTLRTQKTLCGFAAVGLLAAYAGQKVHIYNEDHAHFSAHCGDLVPDNGAHTIIVDRCIIDDFYFFPYLDIAPTVHSFYAEMLAVLLPEATRCKLYEQASGISLRAPPVA